MAADPRKRRRPGILPVSALAALMVFCDPSSAQTGGAQADGGRETTAGAQSRAATTFRANVHLAVADVVVTDRHGVLVHGLTAEDFHVFENGAQQKIASFEEHPGSAGLAPTAATVSLPPPDTYSNATPGKRDSPLFVILLDSLNTVLSDQSFAQSEMLKLVQGLPRGSRVAVFRLGSKLSMLQGFTEDAATLAAVIKGKRAAPQLGAFIDDPNIDLTLNAPDLTAGMGGGGGGHTLSLQDASEAGIQNDVVVGQTIRALGALGFYLSGFPGRKNLVWLAGSFPVDIIPNIAGPGPESSPLAGSRDPFRGNRAYTVAIRNLALLLQSGNITVYPMDVRGLVDNGLFNSAGIAGATTQSSTQTLEAFAANNEQVHAIMETIAKETGGRAYYNNNDIKSAAMEVFNNGSNYYSLSYVPSDQNWDGKFRKIRIEVTHPDAKLYYRSGYYAEEPDKIKNSFPAPDPSMKWTMMHGGPAVSDVTFRVHLKPEGGVHTVAVSEPALQSRNDKTMPELTGPVVRYTLEYTISASEVEFLTTQQGLSRCNLTFSAIAYDANGKMLNSNVGKFDTPIRQEVYAAMKRDALHIRTWMNLPPGMVYLRVGMHDLTTDRLGSFEIPLDLTADTSAAK